MNRFLKLLVLLYLVKISPCLQASHKEPLPSSATSRLPALLLLDSLSPSDLRLLLEVLLDPPSRKVKKESPLDSSLDSVPDARSVAKKRKRAYSVERAEEKSQSLTKKVSQFDFSDTLYPFLSKIILQNHPQKTVTLVLNPSPEKYDPSIAIRINQMIDQFEDILKIQKLYKRIISRKDHSVDHALIEHFSCDDPYIRHMHFELNFISEYLVDILIRNFELESFRAEITSLFLPLCD